MLYSKGVNLTSSFEVKFTWTGSLCNEIIHVLGFERMIVKYSFKSVKRFYIFLTRKTKCI